MVLFCSSFGNRSEWPRALQLLIKMLIRLCLSWEGLVLLYQNFLFKSLSQCCTISNFDGKAIAHMTFSVLQLIVSYYIESNILNIFPGKSVNSKKLAQMIVKESKYRLFPVSIISIKYFDKEIMFIETLLHIVAQHYDQIFRYHLGCMVRQVLLG